MRKLLLVSLLATFALSDQCTYNYNQMVETISKIQRAGELKMYKERMKLVPILMHYTNNAVLTCPQNGMMFHEANRIKGYHDELQRKLKGGK